MELGKLLVSTRCVCLVSVPVPGITAGATTEIYTLSLHDAFRSCWGYPQEAVCSTCGEPEVLE